MFVTSTAIVMFKNNNDLAVMFTYLTSFPATVLINLEDHFLQFCKQFEFRCGPFLCLTSNGCPKHMMLVT